VPCPDPDDSASAQGSFERGKTLLDGSRVGEHYLAEPFSKGLALLRSAAAKGHVEAQYLYGSVRFSETFMQDAPGPADEGAYVSSLTYLRTAALRGHDKARDYIPGLATLQLDAKGHLQKPLPEPLDQVPADWVRRAVIDSDALAACP
jgi:TPR repeat protein